MLLTVDVAIGKFLNFYNTLYVNIFAEFLHCIRYIIKK